MRIGVFSDSHGDVSAAKRYFHSIAPVDALFHLGDYAAMRRAADLISPENAADRYVQNYLAMLLFKEGRAEEGKALVLSNPVTAPDIREGDESLSWCYAEATGEEIPADLDFRMFHEREGEAK